MQQEMVQSMLDGVSLQLWPRNSHFPSANFSALPVSVDYFSRLELMDSLCCFDFL